MKTNTNRWDILTGRNWTIDLQAIHQIERESKLEKLWLIPKLTITEKLIMNNMKFTTILALIWIVFILLAISILKFEITSADESDDAFTNLAQNLESDQFKYYWVNNWRDLERKKRLEVCQRTNREATKEQILHCGTMNTLVTWIESNWMQSNRCKEFLNCKWLKGWQNGRYGFMKFDSYYKENIYFSEKFWEFHYKKSLFTFVYWFKQNDWSWKYWWTATQQDTYLEYMTSNYTKTYNELALIY